MEKALTEKDLKRIMPEILMEFHEKVVRPDIASMIAVHHEKVVKPDIASMIAVHHEKVVKPDIASMIAVHHEKVVKPDIEGIVIRHFDEVAIPVLDDIYNKMATKKDLGVVKKDLEGINIKLDRVEKKMRQHRLEVLEVSTNHENRLSKVEEELGIEPGLRLVVQ